jgi:RNA polymerase sigma-70 factor (ECF subfamily)
MADQDPGRTLGSGAGFPATRWSLVDLASGTGGSEALERLCLAYWYPLYAFARRSGQNPADAEDLTQGFFQKLLEKNWLADAEREKGRLRTFLLTAFRRYMANEWRRDHTDRRGGGWTKVAWEHAEGEVRYSNSRTDEQAEELFDRQWALAVMEQTLDGLQHEMEQRGKSDHFEELKCVLMLEKGAIDYAVLAERLGMKEGAVRVAVHRLRKRFRLRFREEVALTLEEGEDLGEELQYLACVLAN